MAKVGRPMTLTKERGDALAPKIVEWARRPSNKIMARWLANNQLDRKTVIDLQDRSEIFRSAYRQAMLLLEANLFAAAEKTKSGQAIYILALKNAHSWRDKHDIEHSGSIGSAADIIRKAHMDSESTTPGAPDATH